LQELIYKLALTQVSQIGPILARQLLTQFETAENIFKEKLSALTKLEGFGTVRAKAIKEYVDFDQAEKEIKFAQKHHIEILTLDKPNFPSKLKNCIDAPLVLFYRGNANLNTDKIISIVGRRKHTEYGKRIVEELCDSLKNEQIVIVSGLAHGIDSIAHKQCVLHKIPTVGALAHGLDRIYPAIHRNLAKEMLDNGGLITEYWSGTNPDKQNFPMRNRIVAGISDATIVVETDIKGGSMITASLANGYNKDVLAYPGSIYNSQSSGCNYLIKTHRANLISEPKDLFNLLGWNPKKENKKVQKELFIELEPFEQIIYDFLHTNGISDIDTIINQTKLSPSIFAGAALSLEMQFIVQSLPGKMYKIID
jgi:DNA processing protein